MDLINHQHATSSVTSIPNATHCVFRRGSCWLALPANAVREALPRPDMVFVPGTPDSFVGLCHVRSEFIPVLDLDSILPECDQSNETLMLIVDDRDAPWAVMVDEVTSLKALEISDAPAADILDTSCVVVGWATHGRNVVQVIDPSRIRILAEQELAAMWQSADRLPQKHTNPET